MIDPAAVAWSAGYFEGEGAVVVSARTLKVSSTDCDVLRRLQALVGGSVNPNLRAGQPAHYKSQWRWHLNAWREVERVAWLWLPWMCSRREGAMRELLARPAGKQGRHGRRFRVQAEDRARVLLDDYVQPAQFGAVELIAWSAGVFEGEGHVVAPTERSPYQRRLQITSTDRDVLERVALAVGGRVVHKSRVVSAAPHYKDAFSWVVSAWPDVERIATLWLPWLGDRRAAAINGLLGQPPTRKTIRNEV